MAPPAARHITNETDAPGYAQSGWDDFFPLKVGYRWSYVSNITFRSSPGSSPLEIRRLEYREIIGTEELFGRTYFVERQWHQVVSPLGNRQYTWWVRYRQDRDGLYEADICLEDPPGPGGGCDEDVSAERLAIDAGSANDAQRQAFDHLMERRMAILGASRGLFPNGDGFARSPGDEPPPEHPDLVRLRYPLHPGVEWFVRPEGIFHSEVQARDVITTSTGRYNAWRISITPPGFGPNDVAHFWFGRPGLVRVLIHIEDGYGSYDEEMELQPVALAIY